MTASETSKMVSRAQLCLLEGWPMGKFVMQACSALRYNKKIAFLVILLLIRLVRLDFKDS